MSAGPAGYPPGLWHSERRIAVAFEAHDLRMSGKPGRWTAPCPVCREGGPRGKTVSLYRDGMELRLRCYSVRKCSAVDILAAVGLSPVDVRLVTPAPEDVTPYTVVSPNGHGPQAVRLSRIKPEDVTYLWQGYLACGKPTLIDGDPGTGKSTLTIDLMARVTTGSRMPDGSPCLRKGPVLLLTAEDGLADTVRPRVDAAGGDPEQIVVFHEVVTDEGIARPPTLPEDLPHIEAMITKHRVVMVVIDPLMAYVGGKVDSHRDADIRRMLHPLAKLAERCDVSVVLVRHLNKDSKQGRAMYRGGGSIGITGAARAVFLVAPDPNDEAVRVFAPVKFNCGPMPGSLCFRLLPATTRDCAALSWDGPCPLTADDLLAKTARTPGRPPVEQTDAEDFILAALGGGPQRTQDVNSEAAKLGIKARTLERARKNLYVRAFRKGGE